MMKILVRYARIGMGITLALLLSGLKTASSQELQKLTIPSAVQECETRGEAHVCSTWRWNGKEFVGSWPNGSVGKMSIRIEQVNNAHSATGKATHVTFIRRDDSGVTASIYGVYTGLLRDGKVQDGQAHWTYSGIVRSGSWDCTFLYDPAEAEAAKSASGAM